MKKEKKEKKTTFAGEEPRDVSITGMSAAFQPLTREEMESVDRWFDDYDSEAEFMGEDEESIDPAQGDEEELQRPEMHPEDAAYLEWLARWGALDFALLDYLPYLWANEQLMAFKRIEKVNDERIIRTKQMA